MRTVTAMPETLPPSDSRRATHLRRPGSRSRSAARTVTCSWLAALDKFRGTASAAEAVRAVGDACWELGHDVDEAPLSDGGEGLLDVLGGPNRTSIVTGPLGAPVDAAWRIEHRTAVIEMARASGLALVGGAERQRPAAPRPRLGTGELIDRALEQGARRIIVGLGGSATTDGGLGALEALRSPARLRDRRAAGGVRRAHPVPRRGRRVRPAEGRHPGAGRAADGAPRTARPPLPATSTASTSPRSTAPARPAAWPAASPRSAAGSCAGFDLVADHVDLERRISAADVVVTGEGHLDAQSLEGKVVGGVCELAATAGRRVVVIVGDAEPDVAARCRRDPASPSWSLVERFGEGRAVRRAAVVHRARRHARRSGR